VCFATRGFPVRKPAMVLPPSPKRRLRGKVSPSAINVFTKEKRQLTLKHAQRLLPNLYAFTKGAHFEAEAWLRWLRGFRPGLQLPSVQEASELLMQLSQSRRVDRKVLPAPAAWKPQGVRFMDEQGDARVQNLHGFEEQSGLLTWHEYGGLFRLRRHPSERGIYAVERSAALQRARAIVSRRTVGLQAGKKSAFKSSIVIDTLPPSGPVMEPQWSFIYLHSFSQKGTDYLDFPHYFNVCGANVRVVVPTAPLLEQQCFKDWYVWRGERLQWRRIKFNAWFDYLTDKGGVAENEICIKSLLAVRERLHGLLRQEVQRVGDPRRVIVGGASQGCCAALDAALTFEQELGGVIGLVGHLLSSTPLDQKKLNMPLHLFHEEADKEMRWKWVKPSVQRLIDAGFNVSSKRERDPAGCGHWIQEIEGTWIRSAMRHIVLREAP